MKEINIALTEPTHAKEITLDEIQEKYQNLTMEKGINGLDRFYDYYITDEWVEVEKNQRFIEPAGNKYFLGVKTIRIDKDGSVVSCKGTVSLNKLVHDVPAYKEVNGSYIIEYVQQIRGIPSFKAEPLSVMEYIQKYLVGKCLRGSEEFFSSIVPEFVDRKPTFFTTDGEKLREKSICYFDVEEIDINELLKNR